MVIFHSYLYVGHYQRGMTFRAAALMQLTWTIQGARALGSSMIRLKKWLILGMIYCFDHVTSH